MTLEGDKGAKARLNNWAEQIIECPRPNADILKDFDREEDFVKD